MTPLSTLVYRSKATIPLTELELLYLLGQARGRNQAEMITGLLVYDRGLFYQWIEGPDPSMGKLWRAIKQDPRHRDIEILSEQQIPIRLFRDWHMQLAFREGYWVAPSTGWFKRPTMFWTNYTSNLSVRLPYWLNSPPWVVVLSRVPCADALSQVLLTGSPSRETSARLAQCS